MERTGLVSRRWPVVARPAAPEPITIRRTPTIGQRASGPGKDDAPSIRNPQETIMRRPIQPRIAFQGCGSEPPASPRRRRR